MPDITAFNSCMTPFWRQHQAELYHFLLAKTADPDKAADLLQELFLKARANAETFCEMDYPLAWLYRAARNLLIDKHRLDKAFVEVPESLIHQPPQAEPVASLARCLPETLQSLPVDEAWLIEQCDIYRRPQKEVADELSLTLSALKSRLLRARSSLRQKLVELCDVEADEHSPVCCHKKMH
ncbi:RNA polymerase sigma factor sigM [Cedecea neteri]|uniref:RNA polymerase sigma factor sigM n=1 Tax=Cedecea neteri TaxID=158822 RepID=A0A291DXE6_9ENTR|nr:sigma-70 family RNA polymerase sigma factor [Cedecea neteri]ATF92359.1 RNA polymerase subunit sigma-70 [Cedecea neteri]SQC92595.1 RNA polymerase sigma factor sigM [Cedecea neteri]